MTRQQHIRFWLTVTAVFIGLLYCLHSVLLPFVVGIIIAYFIDPVVDKLEEKGMSRTVATAIVTAGIILIVIGGVFVIVPLLHGQVSAFASRLPDYLDVLWKKAYPLIESIKSQVPEEDVARLTEKISSFAGEVVRWLLKFLGNLLSGGFALFSLLSLIVVTPVVTFYILRDWDNLVAKVDSWLPRDKAETIRGQFREIDRILAGFIRGQTSVCVILGSFYGIGLTLVGLDMGLVIGLSAGALSFIPYVGSITGLVVSVGLAFAQFTEMSSVGMVVGVFLVGQVLEGNFLTPRLVGGHVGLHPVWLIFALLTGGSLFGFLGILVAVPVAAVTGVLVRFALGEYLKSSLYLGKSKKSSNRKNNKKKSADNKKENKKQSDENDSKK